MSIPTVRTKWNYPQNNTFVFTEYFSVCVPILVTYNQYTMEAEEAFCKPNPLLYAFIKPGSWMRCQNNEYILAKAHAVQDLLRSSKECP